MLHYVYPLLQLYYTLNQTIVRDSRICPQQDLVLGPRLRGCGFVLIKSVTVFLFTGIAPVNDLELFNMYRRQGLSNRFVQAETAPAPFN